MRCCSKSQPWWLCVPVALACVVGFITHGHAQSARGAQSALEGVDCSTLWGLAQSASKDQSKSSQDLSWAALKQLGKRECLKSKSKQATAKSLVSGAEKRIFDEIKDRKPDEQILTHLVELATAQISAKVYEEVFVTYRRVVSRLADARIDRRVRASGLWFDYVELVIAASFAIDKIDEGLRIAEDEFKKDRGTPATLQGRLAVKVGDLLLSKVHVQDALRFYSLSLTFDREGPRAQRALYWITLDLFKRGDSKGALKRFAQFKALVSEPDLKARVPVLESVLASGQDARSAKVGKDPEFVKVWRDIDLISRK